ncbi:MAG: DUF4080 domain-containing protein [Pseudomonadota bacterium]
MHHKALLCAVNAKFIHSGLAVRYLKSYCESQFVDIDIAEFSINDNIGNILKKLYCSEANIFAFSCYIWNITLIGQICSSLKKAKPEALILLGGPEVSYNSAEVLYNNPAVDYIIIGEGEASLLELLKSITAASTKLSDVKGIAYRDGGAVRVNPPRPLINDLDTIPFPYDKLDGYENKILYYETSRGCPFNCQYCLSSTIHGIRFFSMDRVKKDIKYFIDAGVKQVKLVDRTFNCDIRRSVEIMNYIMELGSDTNFHFEIAADLIDESFLDTVERAPVGMFQFEIGVQSTNPETLSEIMRKMDFIKVSRNVARLVSFGNCHIHLDLIAGLPYEDLKSFEKSFNDVYALRPDMLQLGFLKLLRGSGMRDRSIDYGMEYHAFPPYEVISTRWLSFAELLELKDIEHVLEQYHNSGRFRHTLAFLFDTLGIEPYELFRRMACYWNSKGHFEASKGMNDIYIIMKQFTAYEFPDSIDSEKLDVLNEYLKLDWLLYSRSGSMPSEIRRFDHGPIKEQLQDYLKNELLDEKHFAAFRGMSMRELLKNIGYEVFSRNIFDCTRYQGEVVMFFPLKSNTAIKKQTFALVPLEKIIDRL